MTPAQTIVRNMLVNILGAINIYFPIAPALFQASDAPENITTIILALIASISIIVSLVVASTAAKRSAFEELEKVVVRQEKDIVTLKEELTKEQTLRRKIEEDLEIERRRAYRYEILTSQLTRQAIERNYKPVTMQDIFPESK